MLSIDFVVGTVCHLANFVWFQDLTIYNSAVTYSIAAVIQTF